MESKVSSLNKELFTRTGKNERIKIALAAQKKQTSYAPYQVPY
jgi:hypothetical protein